MKIRSADLVRLALVALCMVLLMSPCCDGNMVKSTVKAAVTVAKSTVTAAMTGDISKLNMVSIGASMASEMAKNGAFDGLGPIGNLVSAGAGLVQSAQGMASSSGIMSKLGGQGGIANQLMDAGMKGGFTASEQQMQSVPVDPLSQFGPPPGIMSVNSQMPQQFSPSPNMMPMQPVYESQPEMMHAGYQPGADGQQQPLDPTMMEASSGYSPSVLAMNPGNAYY